MKQSEIVQSLGEHNYKYIKSFKDDALVIFLHEKKFVEEFVLCHCEHLVSLRPEKLS